MNQLNLQVSNRYKALAGPIKTTKQLFHTLNVSERFPITDGDLSIVFVSDRAIGKIHADFMADPSATDVITFPANEEMQSAGEIIVSVDHAKARAKELNTQFSLELSLYLVHGWLHLAGYDDREESDRAQMRSAEKQALELLEASRCTHAFKLIKGEV